MNFSNYETRCVANYFMSHEEYINCIGILARDLLSTCTVNDSISMLANSIRDICEYDIEESVKEASSLTRELIFATLGSINFKELSTKFIEDNINTLNTMELVYEQ